MAWDDFPTNKQLASIRKACRILNYDFTEREMPQSRLEARNMLHELWGKVRVKEKNTKSVRTLDNLMGIDPSKDVFRSPKGYGV